MRRRRPPAVLRAPHEHLRDVIRASAPPTARPFALARDVAQRLSTQ